MVQSLINPWSTTIWNYISQVNPLINYIALGFIIAVIIFYILLTTTNLSETFQPSAIKNLRRKASLNIPVQFAFIVISYVSITFPLYQIPFIVDPTDQYGHVIYLTISVLAHAYLAYVAMTYLAAQWYVSLFLFLTPKLTKLAVRVAPDPDDLELPDPFQGETETDYNQRMESLLTNYYTNIGIEFGLKVFGRIGSVLTLVVIGLLTYAWQYQGGPMIIFEVLAVFVLSLIMVRIISGPELRELLTQEDTAYRVKILFGQVIGFIAAICIIISQRNLNDVVGLLVAYISLCTIDSIASSFFGAMNPQKKYLYSFLSPWRWNYTVPILLLITILGTIGVFSKIIPGIHSTIWLVSGTASTVFAYLYPNVNRAREGYLNDTAERKSVLNKINSKLSGKPLEEVSEESQRLFQLLGFNSFTFVLIGMLVYFFVINNVNISALFQPSNSSLLKVGLSLPISGFNAIISVINSVINNITVDNMPQKEQDRAKFQMRLFSIILLVISVLVGILIFVLRDITFIRGYDITLIKQILNEITFLLAFGLVGYFLNLLNALFMYRKFS